eukprot:1159248-Pelagomonas_calceolata.AAC.3
MHASVTVLYTEPKEQTIATVSQACTEPKEQTIAKVLQSRTEPKQWTIAKVCAQHTCEDCPFLWLFIGSSCCSTEERPGGVLQGGGFALSALLVWSPCLKARGRKNISRQPCPWLLLTAVLLWM